MNSNNECWYSSMVSKCPMMSILICILICILIIICLMFGCSGASKDSVNGTADNQPKQTEIQKSEEHIKCGDGVCDEFELAKGICPRDCGTDNPSGIRTPGTVYFGFMVHLEGWDDEMIKETKFRAHANEARKLANIFDQYDAKVTFEASPEFVEGCIAWNDNVLQELHDGGHGIGVHADKGYYPSNPGYTLEQFTFDIRQMKKDMEDLVDFEIQHVSGICSDLDWAKAAIDAGYVFTTGGVGYCCQSMPVDMRPNKYKICISPAHCHGNMPLDMEDRINPWKINTAIGNWTVDDPSGELVNLASDSGIKNLYEETFDSSQTHGDMDYSVEDIGVLVEKVEKAISISDVNEVNILYFSLSIGAADVNADFYLKMFEALQPYVDAGQLEYWTMNQMYKAYIAVI